MSQPIKIPGGINLFLVIGNESHELAKHIYSSIRDHIPASQADMFSCISFVDNEFDQESDFIDGLYYSYGALGEGRLCEEATKVVAGRIRTIMQRLDGKKVLAADLHRIRFVIVAAAGGQYSLAELDELREALCCQQENVGRIPYSVLCITTESSRHNRQHEWLMTEDGQLRNEIDHYSKVLILSNQDMNGFETQRVAQNMQDAAFPALLMMLNPNNIDSTSRLFTASYNKDGGTSSDILELRKHIAAEVLEGYFANTSALTKADIWRIFSVADMKIDLQKGNSALERTMIASEAHIPLLEHVILTADIENRDFDPIEHVISFDEFNRESMFANEDWLQKWLVGTKENLRQEKYYDAIREMLSEDGDLYKEVLHSWSDLLKKQRQIHDADYVRKQLTNIDISAKKGFFKSRQDHNLMLLSAVYGVYAGICKERFAFRILETLQQAIPALINYLNERIEERKDNLGRYKMKNEKMKMLCDMCSRAATDIRSSYSKPGIVQDLPTFIKYSNKLYSEDSEEYWKKLYKQFFEKGRRITEFSDAFIKDSSDHQIREKVSQIELGQTPLIPMWPDELGPLPQPMNWYLLNEKVADHIKEDMIQSSNVYAVPGDILEHVGLYSLSQKYDTLKKLNLFRKTENRYNESYDDSGWIRKKPRNRMANAENTDSSGNPWNICIRETATGKLLCWDYPNKNESITIKINQNELVDKLLYSDYKRYGMGYPLKADDIPSGGMQIEIECGERKEKMFITLVTDNTAIVVVNEKTKATINNRVFFKGYACCTYIDDSKCLKAEIGNRKYRMTIPVDERDAISPLWNESGNVTITIENK